MSLRVTGSDFLNYNPILCSKNIKISISASLKEFSKYLIESYSNVDDRDWNIKKCKKQFRMFLTLSLASPSYPSLLHVSIILCYSTNDRYNAFRTVAKN